MLEDKVALITGRTSGAGLGIACWSGAAGADPAHRTRLREVRL